MTGDQDLPDPAAQNLEPSTDILIGLVAIVLLVVITLVPLLDIRGVTTPTDVDQPFTFTVAGQDTLLIVVDAAQLHLVEGQDLWSMPVDNMHENKELDVALGAALADARHPVLFLTPSGQAAAFLLETRLAQIGISDVTSVFVGQTCAASQGPIGVIACAQRRTVR